MDDGGTCGSVPGGVDVTEGVPWDHHAGVHGFSFNQLSLWANRKDSAGAGWSCRSLEVADALPERLQLVVNPGGVSAGQAEQSSVESRSLLDLEPEPNSASALTPPLTEGQRRGVAFRDLDESADDCPGPTLGASCGMLNGVTAEGSGFASWAVEGCSNSQGANSLTLLSHSRSQISMIANQVGRRTLRTLWGPTGFIGGNEEGSKVRRVEEKAGTQLS